MIRVAVGTAGVLGLVNIKMDVAPTTAHLMTPGKCKFNCMFCAQARTSSAKSNLLSRISWPEFEEKRVFSALKGKQMEFIRACLQVVHSDEHEDFLEYVKKIRKTCDLPISVDLKADDIELVRKTFEAGADVVGLPIDAANPKIYSKIKQGSMSLHMNLIKQAAKQFRGKISTHIMIGLGESEEDAIRIIGEMHRLGVTTALFAFTPIKGTSLEKMNRPKIEQYRRIQIARYLIYNDLITNISFDKSGKVINFGFDFDELKEKIDSSAFQTSGCLGCNRPYYNETPSGVMYNYPHVLSEDEYKKALGEAFRDLEG